MTVWVNGQGSTHRLDPEIIERREQRYHRNGSRHLSPERWALELSGTLGDFTNGVGYLLDQIEDPTAPNDDGIAVRFLYDGMRTELVELAAIALEAVADLDGCRSDDCTVPDLFATVPGYHTDPARWWETVESAEADEPDEPLIDLSSIAREVTIHFPAVKFEPGIKTAFDKLFRGYGTPAPDVAGRDL